MLDIPRAVEISESSIAPCSVDADASNSLEVSPHYSEGIVDLEISIENLRKVLEQKKNDSNNSAKEFQTFYSR